MKNWLKVLVLGIVSITFILLLIRAFSAKQLDDVSPEIPCQEKLLENSDILYIIPLFNNQSIAENKEWCSYILSLNKTLGMHGVYHAYQEFLEDRDKEYVQRGMIEFEKCFNITPKYFEPPQLAISKNNKVLVESLMIRHGYFQQITHKVYHCNNSGKYPNWLIRVI